jgi:hypothetical protein
MHTCDHRHNVPVILGMIAPTIDMIYGYVWCLCCDVAVDNLEIRIHKTNSAVTVETCWNYAWRLGSTSQIWLKHVENNHWNNQSEEVTSWCLWNIEIHPQRVPSSCIPILSSFNIGWLFSSSKLLNSGVVPVLKANPTCRQTHISLMQTKFDGKMGKPSSM